MKVENISIDDLKPYGRNARVHSRKQVHQIAASIREFGFNVPVLVDRSMTIIAGHGRVEAARQLNMSEVPVIRIEHLTEAQQRAFILADNKLTTNASWDLDVLRIELSELSSLELDFDPDITGFETAEIDVLIDGPTKPAKADASDLVPDRQALPITRKGDLWRLGQHLLLCGDALEPSSYDRLMGRDRARLVFTDPPYNVPISGHVCGAGAVKHREFAMASGEMTRSEFVAFLTTAMQNLAGHTIDGAIHFVCMDWRHTGEILEAGATAYSELKNICVWVKSNGGMGSFYRSQHELVFVFKHGSAGHLNTVELGKHGRYRTNVWDYAGVNTFKRNRLEELSSHPTVKPVALISDAIKDASRRGDIVLDCFGGSGSTLIAAEKTKRQARLIEIDPAYCDVIVRRWQNVTRCEAIRADTGEGFAKLERDEAEMADILA